MSRRPRALFGLLVVGCSPPAPVAYQAERTAMGTWWEVVVAAPPGQHEAVGAAMADALAAVDEIERLVSTWRPDSELSAVNRAAGQAAVVVSAPTLAMVTRAVELCRRTGGRLDPTFAPLGHLWELAGEAGAAPSDEAVAAARRLVGCARVEIDPVASTLRLPDAGMELGLGATAKGTGVDAASAVLLAAGYRDHIVSGGGDLRASGRGPQGAWTAGVQDPAGPRGALVANVAVGGQGLATSGDYERGPVVGGKRQSHVIDPRTGRPTRGVHSASVLAPDAELADALATALMVAGEADANQILAGFPGARALLVTADGTLWTGPDDGPWQVLEKALPPVP